MQFASVSLSFNGDAIPVLTLLPRVARGSVAETRSITSRMKEAPVVWRDQGLERCCVMTDRWGCSPTCCSADATGHKERRGADANAEKPRRAWGASPGPRSGHKKEWLVRNQQSHTNQILATCAASLRLSLRCPSAKPRHMGLHRGRSFHAGTPFPLAASSGMKSRILQSLASSLL